MRSSFTQSRQNKNHRLKMAPKPIDKANTKVKISVESVVGILPEDHPLFKRLVADRPLWPLIETEGSLLWH